MNLHYVALVTMLAAQIGVAAPRGYRFPNETDFTDDWKLARVERPTPFLVKADFNGDTLPDEAWLLPEVSSPGCALFLVEPGDHQTACGKGYWRCTRDEPEVLKLKLPSIEFFRSESASSIFWWDAQSKKFRRAWISD